MNINITNFLIKNEKLSFLKEQLNKLTTINMGTPVYNDKEFYIFYIGENDNNYLILYGTWFELEKKVLIVNFEWADKNYIKIYDDKLIYITSYNKVLYEKCTQKIDYIVRTAV